MLIFKSNRRKLFFRLQASINDGKVTWKTNTDQVIHTFECNHEEADTQMLLHAALSSEDVVIIVADADAVILMIYAYLKYLVK